MVTLQIPCASLVSLCAGAPTSNSPDTVTSVAFGAYTRKVTRRSGWTSGDRTAGVRLAGGPAGCCAAAFSTRRGTAAVSTAIRNFIVDLPGAAGAAACGNRRGTAAERTPGD